VKSSFNKAFEIVIGLEGKVSDDPRDPGGFTKWGLSSKYNPEVGMWTTLDQAKEIYYEKYWVPAGSETAPFPLDICLFDAKVNPQDNKEWPGNAMDELMKFHPENWQEYLILRMLRYSKCSKEIYVRGHLNRIIRLYVKIKEIQNGQLANSATQR
jgi:hypothetical protein